MVRRYTPRMAGAMTNAKSPQGRPYQEQGYTNPPKGSKIQGQRQQAWDPRVRMVHLPHSLGQQQSGWPETLEWEAALREGGNKGKGAFLHPATALPLVRHSYSDSESQSEQMRQEGYKKVSATVSSAAGTSHLGINHQQASRALRG